jgi:hypothetical protein
MRTKSVLVGYGILYLVVALSFLRVDFIVPPPIDAWEIFYGPAFGAMTLIGIGMLVCMTPLVWPLARSSGISPMYT